MSSTFFPPLYFCENVIKLNPKCQLGKLENTSCSAEPLMSLLWATC